MKVYLDSEQTYLLQLMPKGNQNEQVSVIEGSGG